MAARWREGSRWGAFAVCSAVAVLTILDLVKVNVTLGPVERTLGATASQVQLVVAGYVLAYGIVLVPAGRIGDLWNRKAMFLIGLAAFTAASQLCAVAASAEVLVLGRFAQGVAAGILMPQVYGLIQLLFTGTERGRAFGIFGAAIGLGTAFGPTIGGLLIGAFGEEAGWRAIYEMNVPLAIILFLAAVFLVPGEQERSGRRQLDLVGTVLLAATVLAVMLPFVLTTGAGEDDPRRWWSLPAAAVLVTTFVWWERRYRYLGKTPVVDFALFRTPSYRYGVLVATLFFAAMPPLFLVLTLFHMEGLGHPAVVAGLVSVPYAIVSAITAGVLGRHMHAHGALIVAVGTTLFLLGTLGVLITTQLADAARMPWINAAVLLLAGVGSGALMGANQTRTLQHVPLMEAGVAGSFQQVGQRLGNAIGIAAATSVYLGAAASGTAGAVRSAVAAGLTVPLVAIACACLAAGLDLRQLRRR